MSKIEQKIPEGWSVKKLGDFSSFLGGYAFKSSDMQETKANYQVIKMANVYNDVFDLTRNPSYLCEINDKQKKYLINDQDILISLTGTVGKKDYGYTVFIKKPVNLLLNQRLCLIRCNRREVNSYFLFLLLNKKDFKEQFFLTSIGGTGNQTNVSIVDLKEILLDVPPLAEQEKIAVVLSVWDEGIEKLSDLIGLKEKQKKSLMQKLLTGKTRLSSFSQTWKDVKLGDVAKKKYIIIEKGKPLVSENINKGIIPVIAGGKSVPYYHNQYTHNRACITVSASGAYAGYIWYHSEPIWASDCNVLFGYDCYDTVFLYFVLQHKQEEIYRLQTGGAQPHIYSNDLKLLFIPDINISEQKAIAEVLSTADDEIALLKSKLVQFKEQKKGLMQQLLTGKIRVKVGE